MMLVHTLLSRTQSSFNYLLYYSVVYGTLPGAVARFCGLDPPKDFEAELSGDVGCSKPYDKFLKLAKFPT